MSGPRGVPFDDDDPRRFADAHACERLIKRFAILNDRGEHEALAAMFVEEGSFARPSAPDSPVVGRGAILASFRGRPPRFTRHLVANVLVDVLSHERARAHSDIVLYVADDVVGAPPFPATGPALVGSFEDELVKRDGRWRFLSRRGSLALKVRAPA